MPQEHGDDEQNQRSSAPHQEGVTAVVHPPCLLLFCCQSVHQCFAQLKDHIHHNAQALCRCIWTIDQDKPDTADKA